MEKCALSLEWILQHGGLEGMQKRNKTKADKLYEAIDSLSLFKSPVDKQCRSRMNVVFTMESPELEKEFLKGAEERNMVQLKGHRSTGKSILDDMDQTGCSLISFRWYSLIHLQCYAPRAC